MIDRKKFFDAVRPALYGGALKPGQVAGLDAILNEWERRKLTDLRWLAYMLATPHHETAKAMQPVMETRQGYEDHNPTVDQAISRLESSWKAGKMPWVKTAYWRKDKDGKSWLGRGLPQVTHKANYLKAEIATGIPFTKEPELMLVLEHAVPVMFDGMIDGWFTGRRLGQFFLPNGKCSVRLIANGKDVGDNLLATFEDARKIINGTESKDVVAAYAMKFMKALQTAYGVSGYFIPAVPAQTNVTPAPAVVPRVPATPVAQAPEKPATAAPRPLSFWQRIFGRG